MTAFGPRERFFDQPPQCSSVDVGLGDLSRQQRRFRVGDADRSHSPLSVFVNGFSMNRCRLPRPTATLVLLSVDVCQGASEASSFRALRTARSLAGSSFRGTCSPLDSRVISHSRFDFQHSSSPATSLVDARQGSAVLGNTVIGIM